MLAKLAYQSYGKSHVRLTKVTRHADRHDLTELCVSIQLEGDFAATYLTGDNSRVIATDSMKNTVYVFARNDPLSSIEGFARTLGRHFVSEYPRVSVATVSVREDPWQRIKVRGAAHPHAFVRCGKESPHCTARVLRDSSLMKSGFDDLVLLKTTDSAFTGYIKDRFTTLKETSDRIFATSLCANWDYSAADPDWNTCRELIRRTLMEVFAMHMSLSVQQTLFAMGQAALDACPDIRNIHLDMPNKHRNLVNLEPFDQDNPNVIFVPTDEPFGRIEARLTRE